MKNNLIRWRFFWFLMFYDLFRWFLKSKKLPLPYLLKRKVLLDYIRLYKIEYFVETGTCYGDMIQGMKNHVSNLISIEIDEKLYKDAYKRFYNNSNVELYLGDSSIILKHVVEKIKKPVLFYLDAHYSGEGTGMGLQESPLLEELKILLKANCKPYVILIDDARHLGQKGYPSFLEIKNIVTKYTDYKIYNKRDFIRIQP